MYIIHGRIYSPGRSKSRNTFKQCANQTEVEEYLAGERRKLDPDVGEKFFRIWQVEEEPHRKVTFKYPFTEQHDQKVVDVAGQQG